FLQFGGSAPCVADRFKSSERACAGRRRRDVLDDLVKAVIKLSWKGRRDATFRRLFEGIAEFDEARLTASHARETDAEWPGLRIEAVRKGACIRYQRKRDDDRWVAGTRRDPGTA